MSTTLSWFEDLEPPPRPALRRVPGELPPSVEAALWRGSDLGRAPAVVRSSGWPELDAELPGGGWPVRAVTEILTAQGSVLEWRLLAPALAPVVASGGQVVLVGPPRHPHLPGLQHVGLDERQLVWIRAEAPAERLWTVEQLIKSNAAAAVIAWLPQARQDQLRRLQVCAHGCDGLVWLCRPDAARHEASAAPLRVRASVSIDWQLHVHVLKRRGPAHEQPVVLPSIPGGLSAVLTPRALKPSALLSSREAADVVGSPVVSEVHRQHAAAR